jgi:pullulanase
MFSVSKIMSKYAFVLVSLLLTACGGGGVSGTDTAPGQKLLTCNAPLVINATGDACVEPAPISCPAGQEPNEYNDGCVPFVDETLPPPAVSAGANQAILFYNRADASYDDWKLHIWNSTACDAYTDAQMANVTWSDGVSHSGIDPNYGAYWILELKEDHNECGNYIIHFGDDKEQGGADKKMDLTTDRMNWALSGVSDTFANRLLTLGVSVSGASAHWVDTGYLLWNTPASTAEVRVHASASGDLEFDAESGVTGGTSIRGVAAALPDNIYDQLPHLNNLTAYALEIDAANAKSALRGEVMAVAYDAEGAPLGATRIQIPGVLDALYTSGDNDADEATLGVIYSESGITAKVWAPTAINVNLVVYNADKSLSSKHGMVFDDVTGIWSFSGSNDLNRKFYRYEVTVFDASTSNLRTIESTDPYSVSLSTNGRFSQFVNLADADLKPAGWDNHTVPTIQNPEDAVIYEGHIRDFSIWDDTVSAVNRGKYMAFTELESDGMKHLAALAEVGLTHFHMLPANDIASVNEDPAAQINLTDTVGRLCVATSAAAPVCGKFAPEVTLAEAIATYDPASSDAQALINYLRGFDAFNWGYDPQHFNAPDGSYASNADGVARIVEMRAMNKALHDIGLRVVLDVVYNHTSSSGFNDNSVFDKIVPGYYHRLNTESGSIEQSTCCENLAPENRMMGKFMVDSLVLWTEAYGFDGFRFDIMGHIPRDLMLEARTAVQMVDSDNYFYGEGWNFGEVADNARFTQASQLNLGGTEIGSFNDRIREAIRGGDLFKASPNLAQMDFLRLGLVGTLKDYILKDYNDVVSTGSSISWNGQSAGYAEDPADIINYVSKHDNETLWDKLQFVLPTEMSREDRVRAQNIAASAGLMGQGIPFLQLGGDMIRSKSMDRNTYDAGDWFNRIDYTMQSNNWNVGLPLAQDNSGAWEAISGIIANSETAVTPDDIALASATFKEFLAIRSSSALFRLTTAQDIIDRVGFHNIGSRQTPGLIVMSIDDGVGLTDIDSSVDAIVVVINGTSSEQTHTVNSATGFSLHPVLQNSMDSVVKTASFADGAFTVPAYTMAVFVKAQGEAQGEGLAADATSGQADVVPYGSTTVYVRGGMNGWSEENPFSYLGSGIYAVDVALTAGDYEFKIASADWSTVDFGAINADSADVLLATDENLAAVGANMRLSITESDTYTFRLDALDPANPVLNVVQKIPFADNTILLRGSLNGWDESSPFSYQGKGIYVRTQSLTAGSYEFKVATADWSTVDLGALSGDVADVELTLEEATAAKGANFKLSIPADGSYDFVVDASFNGRILIMVFPSEDYDSDGIANGVDEDIDGDGVLNINDAFIYNKEESVDTDGDGVGDNADAFPNDSTEQFDANGNGIGDNADAANAEETPDVVVGFGNTVILLRGDMNGWGTTNAFISNDAGRYAVEVTLEAGTYGFKVASEDWSSVNLGAADSAAASLTLGSNVSLLQGSQDNLSLVVDAAGTYVISVDARDASQPVISIRDAVPFMDTTVLLRGDMNGWSESDALAYVGDGVYELQVTLATGDYQFKVASADWSTVNLGAASLDTAVVGLNSGVTLLQGSNDNLSTNIASDGDYIVRVNALFPDAPVLTISTPVPYGDATIYLKGAMNGWSNALAFTYQGNGVYSATTFLDAASYEFKIADANWGPINIGAGQAGGTIVLGEALILELSGNPGNLTIAPTVASDFTFTLDASDDINAPVLTVTNTAPFAANTPLLRGSLNGWGDTSPFIYQGKGIYIAELSLLAGDYEFKVATSDWSTVNLGAANPDDKAATLTNALTLQQNSQDNLTLSLAADGNYVFVIDASDVDAPVIRVRNAAMFAPTTIYLRGALNEWGTANPFAFADGVYSTTVTIVAGTYEFKIADADWAVVNVGAGSNGMVVLGETLTLSQGSNPGNLTITIDTDGDYVFTLRPNDYVSPQLQVVAI